MDFEEKIRKHDALQARTSKRFLSTAKYVVVEDTYHAPVDLYEDAKKARTTFRTG